MADLTQQDNLDLAILMASEINSNQADMDKWPNSDINHIRQQNVDRYTAIMEKMDMVHVIELHKQSTAKHGEA